jgi:transcriptional regulator GlxA family with amidase domain
MRDTVYFLAFDGFADWHAAQALCEIRRPGEWRLQTVGFSMQPVLSMAGLRVLPELTLDQVDLKRAALLILPGGYLWERGLGEEAVTAARRVHAAGASVAAVDSGVLVLARAGLLDACRHTGSWPGHIGTHVPA